MIKNGNQTLTEYWDLVFEKKDNISYQIISELKKKLMVSVKEGMKKIG